MKHEGSRQVGGFRSTRSGDKPATPARTARTKHKQPPRSRRPSKREAELSLNARFHAEINKLRSALWNNDLEHIPQLEARIDQIVREWEAQP